MAEISTSALFDETRSLASRHSGFLLTILLTIAAGYSALDLLGSGAGNSFASIVVGIFVQYAVMERLLADHARTGLSGKRRYWTLFGSGLLYGLGVLIGLIFLVLPGIYLAGRWLSSSAYVVVEGRSAADSLDASWNQSRANVAGHIALALVAFLPTVALFAFFAIAEFGSVESAILEGSSIDGPFLIILSNLIATFGSILAWVTCAAAYSATHSAGGELEDVFA